MNERQAILSKWDETWGDRLQELVLIGVHMNENQIRKQLENCLLTPEEIAEYQNGNAFTDTWPL